MEEEETQTHILEGDWGVYSYVHELKFLVGLLGSITDRVLGIKSV